MGCYKCKGKTNGAYFKNKPICPVCWRARFPPLPKDSFIERLWEKHKK